MVNFNNLQLFSLEKVEKEFGYIYFLFHQEHLLYIGQSSEVRNRIKSHQMYKIFDKVLYEEHPASQLKQVEKEYIKYYQPVLNQQLNTTSSTHHLVIDNVMHTDSALNFNNTSGSGCSLTIRESNKLYLKNNFVGFYSEKYNRVTKVGVEHFTVIDLATTNRLCMETFSAHTPLEVIFNKYDEETGKILVPYEQDYFIQTVYDDDFIFPVGKYKTHSVRQIKERNPQYVTWFYENVFLNEYAVI